MKKIIETERFYLREILPTDVDGLFELDSDADVHRYLGNNPVNNKNQIVDVISFIRQQYIDNGIGRLAIIEKESNGFVGWAGLKLITETTNNNIDFYDLGYRLIKKYWNKGIGTEVASATLKYAFDELNLTEVYAMADCDNVGSNKILKKIGFDFIETFDLDEIQHNWYKIERENYYIQQNDDLD